MERISIRHPHIQRHAVAMLRGFAHTLAPLPLPDGWMVVSFFQGLDSVEVAHRHFDRYSGLLRVRAGVFEAPGGARVVVEAEAYLKEDMSVARWVDSRIQLEFVVRFLDGSSGCVHNCPDRGTVITALLAIHSQIREKEHGNE